MDTHALLRLEFALEDYLSATYVYLHNAHRVSDDLLAMLVNLGHNEGTKAASEPVRGGKVPHGMLES